MQLASKMTYIVSGGELNSTHSLTNAKIWQVASSSFQWMFRVSTIIFHFLELFMFSGFGWNELV